MTVPVAALPEPVVVTAAGASVPAIESLNWSPATDRLLGSSLRRRRVAMREFVNVQVRSSLAAGVTEKDVPLPLGVCPPGLVLVQA